MITLSHAPPPRAPRFPWLLEEIREPYQVRHVEVRRRHGSGHPPG